MEAIGYKEGAISIGKAKVKEKLPRKWICPICKNEIKLGDEVYMLINNQVYFPNCMVHHDCFNEEEAVNIFRQIEKLGDKYKEIKDVF